MLESFMVAFNAVAPFLILLGIGFAAVRFRLTDREFMNKLNTLNFKLFFPFLMFKNVYGAKPENMPSVKLMLTGFLLLFECRARYLLLYAPYFVVMGMLGWQALSAFVRERTGAAKRGLHAR